MFNPAQLGMNSQTNFLSTEMFSHKTRWLPQFGLNDLWINNYAMMYGIKLPEENNSLISVGLGYSRLFLNLGRFIVTSENSAEPIGTFDGYETSDNFSIGVGIDVGIKAAFGATIKKITSKLSPIGTAEEKISGTANVWASDLGILVKFPMMDIIFKESEHKKSILFPFLDLTTAYALNNLGGRVAYINYAQSDPLPRTARLGWSSAAGVNYHVEKIDITLFNFTVAREAENLLFKRDNIGSWEYDGAPFGNINIYKNLIESEANGYVTVRRGFSVNVFETVTFRQGSYEGDGNLSYETSGFSVGTKGISKIAIALMPPNTDFNPVTFFLSHLEIRFSHSEYTGQTLLNGTGFDNLIFSFHH